MLKRLLLLLLLAEACLRLIEALLLVVSGISRSLRLLLRSCEALLLVECRISCSLRLKLLATEAGRLRCERRLTGGLVGIEGRLLSELSSSWPGAVASAEERIRR